MIQITAADGGIPGHPTVAGAHCSLDSLEIAVGLARSGSAAAVVTGPVSKEQLYSIGFAHPGQTEFVAERCGVSSGNVAMMLAGPTLRTVPVTTHRPVRGSCGAALGFAHRSAGADDAAGTAKELRDCRAHLAVTGLNPHAGEGGMLGREEIELIQPAIAALRAEGWKVTGPHPADTMFHEGARARYDAALCMYHDQALIPLKAIHFEDGVNVTLGLPIIRTAPDHGTAFDIAGQDLADPDPWPRRSRWLPCALRTGKWRSDVSIGAAARRHRAARAPGKQGARPELHPRQAIAGPHCSCSRLP